ncbi:MAG: peptidylprolyl isomerase [Bacteroidales bacterium]|nr:peptidylprolyl isomerase [Bacteroidales bacterium]
MKNSFYIIAIIIFIASSCNSNDLINNGLLNVNKFSDETFREIYNFQDERNTKELLKFLTNRKDKYREAAALAFASVQDSNAIEQLFELLFNDDSENVRIAAAFAIGQINSQISENQLIKAFDNEKSDIVKKYILKALGKTGSNKSLSFVNNLFKEKSNEIIEQAKLLSISRFAIKGISDSICVENIIKIISDSKSSDTCNYLASIALGRIKNQNFDKYSDKITNCLKHTKNIFTQSNLCLALANSTIKNSFNFLDSIIKSDIDYRVKISAIRAISNYENENTEKSVYSSLSDSNVNVAISASEYFILEGKEENATNYFKWAKKQKNWRVRTNLLSAAIKYSKNKKEITNAIISGYNISENIYEKANLLKALGGNPNEYVFVSKEVYNADNVVISTYGMEALAEMRRNKDFEQFNNISIKHNKINLEEEFAIIFKRAILSGDVAMISIAAEIIRDPELNFINQYKNTYFLTQAMNNCILPKEIEAYIEIKKTVSYINGTEEKENPKFTEYKLDWKYIAKINKNQKVIIQTSKGNIELELCVEKAPLTVSTFLKLIDQGFYKNKKIHRVVPNFVIQDGCPRGDGWGSPDFSIRSEFSMINYEEGSIGMASAGKDTESSQWFITHSPTPHLDGRYTNFGKVISGIGIVHQIEVGDEILDMEIVE